jgi:hypothetical protein
MKPRKKTKNHHFIYAPLNAAEFKRRMEDSFSPIHLTSISIIQGVALGFLCQKTFMPGQEDASGLGNILYVAMSFVAIVGVSYEYNWFVGIHRWSQKFLDTLIPLMVGFWEIGAIFNIGQHQRWWMTTGMFILSGAMAFSNTYSNIKPLMFEDEKLFSYFRSNTLFSLFFALIGATFCFGVGTLYGPLSLNLPEYTVDIGASIIYLALFSAVLWKNRKFVDSLHEKLGFER